LITIIEVIAAVKSLSIVFLALKVCPDKSSLVKADLRKTPDFRPI